MNMNNDFTQMAYVNRNSNNNTVKSQSLHELYDLHVCTHICMYVCMNI